MSAVKNPVYVESGRLGARRRWGEKRIARLDHLSPEQRRVIIALLDAMGTKEPATSGQE